MIVVGNQIWETCAVCGKFIRINKVIFGSLHICLTDEERRAKLAKQPVTSTEKKP